MEAERSIQSKPCAPPPIRARAHRAFVLGERRQSMRLLPRPRRKGEIARRSRQRRAPASMDAMHDAARLLSRLRRGLENAAPIKRMVLVTAPGAAFTFVEKPDFRHRSTGLCGELGNEIAHTQAFGARGEGQRHAMLEAPGRRAPRYRRGKAIAARRGGRGRGSRASSAAPRGGQDPKRYAG